MKIIIDANANYRTSAQVLIHHLVRLGAGRNAEIQINETKTAKEKKQ